MKFCDKLIELRRERGYSQEQLASMLGVSRQAVSKWEADVSMPDLSKILQLSDLFQVTTDYLLKEDIETRQNNNEASAGNFSDLNEKQLQILEKLEKMEENEIKNSVREYEYVSPKKLLGLPLLHIHFKWTKGYRKGFGLTTPGAYADFHTKAKGIIAIGNNASGILSIGFLAKGLISLGLFSMGLLSVGIMSLGLLALGILSLGAAAGGVVALGYVAMGVTAIGVYASGVSAIGMKAACGVVAVGRTAVGISDADGSYVMILNDLVSSREASGFLMNHEPDLPGWILYILMAALK